MFLKVLKEILLCALLAALVGVAVGVMALLETTRQVIASTPVEIDRQAGLLRRDALEAIIGTRREVLDEVHAIETHLFARVDRLSSISESQLIAVRQDLIGEATVLRMTADRRFGDTLARVDQALAEVRGLRAELAPTLANTAAITGHAKEASAILLRRDALPAQVLGLTAAAKVTLGETAQTMRSIQEATPEILATVDQIGESSREASQRTAEVMGNLARASKPLPAPIRIGLAVAPPLAQIGASVATTLAVTGKLGRR